MRLAGIQKLTLLDYPGKVACILFTPGCNYRCPFCHNASLVLPDRQTDALPEEQALQFLQKRRGVLDGVVITGGEPLLHDGLAEFLKKIKQMGYSIKLDTNGALPERLYCLVNEGLLDYVAMDIKNSPQLYALTTGCKNVDLDAVAQSKDFLLSGTVPYEFRTTVVKGLHTEQSLIEAAEWINGAKAYFLQQYKNSGDVLSADGLDAFTDGEMKMLADKVRPTLPAVQLRGI